LASGLTSFASGIFVAPRAFFRVDAIGAIVDSIASSIRAAVRNETASCCGINAFSWRTSVVAPNAAPVVVTSKTIVICVTGWASMRSEARRIGDWNAGHISRAPTATRSGFARFTMFVHVARTELTYDTAFTAANIDAFATHFKVTPTASFLDSTISTVF